MKEKILSTLNSQLSTFFVLLILFAYGEFAPATASMKFAADSAPSNRINFSQENSALPGEILVKFRPGTFGEESASLEGIIEIQYPFLNEIFTRLQVSSLKRVFRNVSRDIFRLKYDAPFPILDALTQIAEDQNVEWVEPNYVFSTFSTPNDDFFPLQWGLTKIQADMAWDISTGNPDVVIAIVDTGVDYNHLDLANNIWHNSGEIPDNSEDDDDNGYEDDYIGWDFISISSSAIPTPDPDEDIGPEDNDPMDFHGHGTHCSGIASAVTNNAVGVAGTGWNCKLMCLRAGYKTSGGNGSLPYGDSAAAIEYAVDNGANVISMSWGSTSLSLTIRNVIEYASDAGCILVAAAGNDGKDLPNYPAALPNVISIAASDQDDLRASFSNFGDWVDIASPGKNIYSTTYNEAVNNDTYGYLNGTSMATPCVAGVSALIVSQEPGLTASMVYQRLLDAGDYIDWGIISSPDKRVNAYRALWLGTLSIIINSPASGEKLKGDSIYGITWQTTGEDIDHIHLQYSTDGGTHYQDIAPNTTNDGGYQWNPVPAINSTTVKLKAIIEDADDKPWKEYATGNFTIDSTPPVSTSALSGTQGEGGWYKSDVTVALTSSDNLTGIKETKYSINNGAWQLYTAPFSVSSSSTVKYFSTDNVGNVESTKLIDIKVDKITPVTTANPTGTLGKNGWYKSDVTVGLSALDSTSGVKEIEYKIGEGSWQTYSSPFAIMANSTVYYKSYDNAGNVEADGTLEIKIDKSAPEATLQLAGTIGENGWYIANVTVSLNATDDLSGIGKIEYKINDGLWQTYSSPFVVTGSTVYYRSEDLAGNIEVDKSVLVKIDKSPPETSVLLDGTAGKNGWYKSPVTVKLSATDPLSGVDNIQYKVGDETWLIYSSPFIVIGATVYYKSKDNAGNTETEKSLEVKIDEISPQSFSSISGTVGNNEWYISNVTVTLTREDDLSGILETQYKINDGAWQIYSAPFVVTGSKVYYRSEDMAGNLETEQNIEVKIDKTPPVTDVILTGTNGKNGWYRSDVNVALSATDAQSGVEKIEYRIDNGTWQTYFSTFIVPYSTVSYRSFDNAGNVETQKFVEIKIDKIAPVTTATLTGAKGENGWYISDPTVKLSGVDELSGIGMIQFRTDDNPWQNYTTPFVFSDPNIQYRSEDVAGNLETEKTQLVKIDKTSPSVPVVTDDGKFTNSKTSLHASWTASNDDQSGITEYKYTITNTPSEIETQIWNSAGLVTEINASGLSLTGAKTYYIGVKAKNGAGLLSQAGFSDGIIINAPPVVGIIPNTQFDEDTSNNSIDLDDYISDPSNENSEISWTHSGNENIIVNIDPDTHLVTLTALLNWNGSENITFIATDPGGYTGNNIATITVTPVNDPPTVNNLTIKPLPSGPNDNLIASYIYSDVDSGINNSQIKWYKNGVQQPSLNNSLTVPASLTLLGDEWYFTVTPNDGTDEGETRNSPTVIINGTVQELHFYPGWNLFSIHLDLGNADIQSVLSPIDGFYKSVWSYNAESKVWKRYIPGSTSNSIDTIEPGIGYWIEIIGSEEAILTIIGDDLDDTSISLYTGLNLVGYNLAEPQLCDTALSPVKYTYIYAYDNAAKKWTSHVANGPGFLTNFTKFSPGNGYWIYAKENTIWTVSP